jgi:hypothetical protein
MLTSKFQILHPAALILGESFVGGFFERRCGMALWVSGRNYAKASAERVVGHRHLPVRHLSVRVDHPLIGRDDLLSPDLVVALQVAHEDR